MIFRTSLFEIPFYKTKATNHLKIKEYFQRDIIPNIHNLPPNRQDLNLYSDYFKGIFTSDKNLLNSLYSIDFNKFMQKAGYQKSIDWKLETEIWYNIGVKGTQQEEHDHMGGCPPVAWSAIHYVIFDKSQHDPTLFFNPLYYMFMKNTHPTNKPNFLPNDWQTRYKMPEIEEGDLIFFPSYLKHSVAYQEADALRATTAINLKIYENSENKNG